MVNVPVYTHVTESVPELKLLRSPLIVSQRRYILGSTLLRSLQLTPATAEELPFRFRRRSPEPFPRFTERPGAPPLLFQEPARPGLVSATFQVSIQDPEKIEKM